MNSTHPAPPPVHVPVDGIGWDILSVPCERTDEEGRVVPPPMPLEDPRSPSVRAYDHPEVQALRADLALNNGIKGLEIFSPDDDPKEICRVYRRDGFVVVRDCLTPTQLELLRSGCSKALQMIMDIEPDAGRQIMHETGRLPHRYSYGSSAVTRQQSAWIEWASLVDLPTTTPILEQIFGGLDRYAVTGMGGEIALPGAMEYQRLHMDGAEPSQMPAGRFEHAAALAEAQSSFIAAAGNSPLGGGANDGPDSLAWQRRAIEMTPGLVTINFLVSDMTTENGPSKYTSPTISSSEFLRFFMLLVTAGLQYDRLREATLLHNQSRSLPTSRRGCATARSSVRRRARPSSGTIAAGTAPPRTSQRKSARFRISSTFPPGRSPEKTLTRPCRDLSVQSWCKPQS